MRRGDKVDTLVVTCHECGHPIPSIPTWLATAKVKFECEECRQKSAGRVPISSYEPSSDEALESELPVDMEEVTEEEVEEEDLDIEDFEVGDEVSEEETVTD